MDQADGNIEILEQLAAEEVAGRRETADRLRAALDPAAVEVVLRRGTAAGGNADQADLGIIGRGDFFLGPADAADRHLHVRLARTDPNLADEHVFQRDRVLAGDGERMGTADRHGIEFDNPLARLGVGRGGLALIADFHRDLLALIGPTPDGHGNVALQDGVVGEHGRQPHVGHQRPGENQQRTESDRKRKQAAVTHGNDLSFLKRDLCRLDLLGGLVKAGNDDSGMIINVVAVCNRPAAVRNLKKGIWEKGK